MPLILNTIKVKEPEYFYREYKNDLSEEGSKDAGKIKQGIRIAQAALPFVALYRPVGSALSLIMGGSRTISNASKTFHSFSDGNDRTKIACEMLETTVGIVSLTCTFFALPLGMLVTTCHDLAMNCIHLHQAWKENDSTKAIEAGLHILNNAIYLGLFIIGSQEILVASFALQIIVGIYQTSAEFQKGNYLEAGAGLLMVTVRMRQIAAPVSSLQERWKAESLSKKVVTMQAIENNNTAKSDFIRNGNIAHADVEILVKYGNNPEGVPPLHYASMVGDENAVTMLLDHGASPHSLSRQIQDGLHPSSNLLPLRPLDFAAKGGHVNIMNILINRGAQVNLTEIYYPDSSTRWSPALYFAAKHDQGQAVSFLLQKGALLQDSNSKLNYALEVAIQRGSIQALDALFSHGVNIHMESNQDLLANAVQNNQTKSIEWLMKHKVDINKQINGGPTLLQYSMNCNLSTIECLLKNGANPNFLDLNRHTPLMQLQHWQPGNTILDRAKLLIEFGADISVRNSHDQTYFEIIMNQLIHSRYSENDPIKHDYLSTADLLLRKGYNINTRNSQNRTVLHGLQDPNLNEYQKKIKDWLLARGATV